MPLKHHYTADENDYCRGCASTVPFGRTTHVALTVVPWQTFKQCEKAKWISHWQKAVQFWAKNEEQPFRPTISIGCTGHYQCSVSDFHFFFAPNKDLISRRNSQLNSLLLFPFASKCISTEAADNNCRVVYDGNNFKEIFDCEMLLSIHSVPLIFLEFFIGRHAQLR